MRAVALLVLSLSAAARAYSHLHDGTHTHRLVKRTAADTAGAVVGVLLFFLFVGFCWIMCQHPQWNPCGDCQCCCCCCCGRPRPPHPAVAFLQLGPAHWLYVTSRGRWGTKAERPPDLEMQALGDDFVQQHRAPSYEAREMRVPTPAPSSHRSSPSPPPPPAARIHRDRSQRLQVPERAARSHSRTRSEAAERRVPPEPAHERTLSDPTDRAFADIFGEGGPRPAPPPLTRGREKAIDRWRRTVAGE